MWKVKRMNTARIVVLTTADIAGGIAAYLANRSDNTPLPAEPVVRRRPSTLWWPRASRSGPMARTMAAAPPPDPRPEPDQDTEVTERTPDMKCRGHQRLMRTFLVRALSFSAVAALTLNPVLTPVMAATTAPPRR